MNDQQYFENVKSYKLLANKSLGQNFLINSETAKKIVDLLEISEEDAEFKTLKEVMEEVDQKLRNEFNLKLLDYRTYDYIKSQLEEDRNIGYFRKYAL